MIAPRGYRHGAWSGSFYPDDLPGEWMLAYFANEFPAVLLPEAEWLPAGAATIEGWLADTGSRFRFFLEVDRAGARVEAVSELLGERCGGWVAPADAAGEGPWVRSLRRVAGRPAPRVLRSELEALQLQAPPRLLVIDGVPPDLSALRDALTIAALLGV